MSKYPNYIKVLSRFLSFILLIFAFHLSPLTSSFANEDNLSDAIKNGKFIFDGRLRYENVDIGGVVNDADGLTFRARLGFQTAKFKNFQFLVEGDFTQDLGVNNFNSTVNGKVAFPVIADPNSVRLNRMSLGFTGIKDTTISVGRHRLILDNARFVGNVGFRQNEQTFDSVLFQTKVVDGVTFTYVYVIQVNRIFGSKSAVGQLDTNTHLFNVSYDKLPIGKITGYAYFMNVDGAAAASNQTYGIRLTGNQELSEGVKFVYSAGFAHQKNYKNNPITYSEGFFEIEGGITAKGFVGKVGYEVLKGNGVFGFQTPLATGHKFQGFADVFLATPATGIEDLYFVAGYTAKEVKGLGDVSFMVWYHDFSPQTAGADLGEEIDFRITAKPTIAKKKVLVEFKFAKFQGSPILPDVRKFWITLGLAF